MDKENTIKRMELARTGQFGMDGAVISVTDLQEVKETFDGRAPVSIGHDMTKKEDWWPSFGNVVLLNLEESEDGQSATLSGDVLLHSVLAEAIEQGFYDGWSISIPRRGSDSKRYLHHLAFLGAVPPKIRDLRILKELKDSNAPQMETDVDFADSFVFHKSDFKTIKEKEISVETKKKEKEEDTAELAADFSDKKIESANKILKSAQRTRIKTELQSKVPAGMMDSVLEFSDALCEVEKSSDFADAEESLVSKFVEIIKSIPGERDSLTQKHEFSDSRKSPEEVVDTFGLAQKY